MHWILELLSLSQEVKTIDQLPRAINPTIGSDRNRSDPIGFRSNPIRFDKDPIGKHRITGLRNPSGIRRIGIRLRSTGSESELAPGIGIQSHPTTGTTSETTIIQLSDPGVGIQCNLTAENPSKTTIIQLLDSAAPSTMPDSDSWTSITYYKLTSEFSSELK